MDQEKRKEPVSEAEANAVAEKFFGFSKEGVDAAMRHGVGGGVTNALAPDWTPGAKRASAPGASVTLEHIEGCIVAEYYSNGFDAFKGFLADKHELKRLTLCVLVLKNGFTVTGESACVDMANFDADIGRNMARANAVNKIWQLEGYLLKQRLSEAVEARTKDTRIGSKLPMARQNGGSSSFGQALHQMKAGDKVARMGWNGKGMFIAVQWPDQHSKMKSPYIYMSPVGGALVPWLASQSDMLAEDWYIVD